MAKFHIRTTGHLLERGRTVTCICSLSTQFCTLSRKILKIEKITWEKTFSHQKKKVYHVSVKFWSGLLDIKLTGYEKVGFNFRKFMKKSLYLHNTKEVEGICNKFWKNEWPWDTLPNLKEMDMADFETGQYLVIFIRQVLSF